MNATYGRRQRLLEYGAIFLFALLLSWSVARLAAVAAWHIIPILLVAAPLGWLAADLLSGLLHWTFDSWGSIKTPLIGNAFIRPFREHHVDPEAMTHHDFVETHGASCLAALPLLTLCVLLPLATGSMHFFQAFLFSIAFGALATNQCHKWAHMAEASTPAIVRWAQDHRLVLPRTHHQLHHTPPFDTHFCMSSGWLNRPFNFLLRVFR